MDYFSVLGCYLQPELSKGFLERPPEAAPAGSSSVSLRLGWGKGSFKGKGELSDTTVITSAFELCWSSGIKELA